MVRYQGSVIRAKVVFLDVIVLLVVRCKYVLPSIDVIIQKRIVILTPVFSITCCWLPPFRGAHRRLRGFRLCNGSLLNPPGCPYGNLTDNGIFLCSERSWFGRRGSGRLSLAAGRKVVQCCSCFTLRGRFFNWFLWRRLLRRYFPGRLLIIFIVAVINDFPNF